MNELSQTNQIFLRKQALLWGMQACKGKSMKEVSGWQQSLNRSYFSDIEMQEFADNVFHKLHIPYLISGRSAILEIGVGSGIILQRLSPYCMTYDAVDIDDIVLEKCRFYLPDYMNNVRFFKAFAHEVDRIPETYDVIILNSVMQYFPDEIYAESVLRICQKKLRPHGVLFCGDIMDEEKKALLAEYISKEAGESLPRNFEHTLFFRRSFFTTWKTRGRGGVVVSDKLGLIANELTLFRFDVMLYA